MPNEQYDKSTISGAARTYNGKKISNINGVTTINGRQYDNQWREIDGASTINRVASMIRQSMNGGASDVLEPNFDAARPETGEQLISFDPERSRMHHFF